MAKGIRFTAAERDFLKRALPFFDWKQMDPKAQKWVDSILEKLELAELPVKKGTYLTVPDAISAFRGVLGQRLVAPGFEARGVLAQMKNRIQALGLTRSDCVVIAKIAGEQWRGPIRAESLVRQADVLMAGAQGQFRGHGVPDNEQHPTNQRSSPVELSDDDI